MNALSHFTAVHGQNHGTIFGNFDPTIEGYTPFGEQHVAWFAHARTRRHETPANHQRTRDTQATQDQMAALHACAPAAR